MQVHIWGYRYFTVRFDNSQNEMSSLLLHEQNLNTTPYKGKSEQVCRLHKDKVGKPENLVGM
jgi:hypothetical protein